MWRWPSRTPGSVSTSRSVIVARCARANVRTCSWPNAMSSSTCAGTRSRLAAISSASEPEALRLPAVEPGRVAPHGGVPVRGDGGDDLVHDRGDGVVAVGALLGARRLLECLHDLPFSRFDYVCITLGYWSCQLRAAIIPAPPPARAANTPRQRAASGSGEDRSVFCDAPTVAVTSKDIARKLRISQSTVSRALRGDPRVAADTAARVLEAARADELHAEPRRAEPHHAEDGHRRGGRERHHEPVLSRSCSTSCTTSWRSPATARSSSTSRRTRASSNTSASSSTVPRSTGSSTSRRRSTRRSRGRATRDLPIVLVNRYIDAAAVDTVVSDNERGGPPRRRGDRSRRGTGGSR